MNYNPADGKTVETNMSGQLSTMSLLDVTNQVPSLPHVVVHGPETSERLARSCGPSGRVSTGLAESTIDVQTGAAGDQYGQDSSSIVHVDIGGPSPMTVMERVQAAVHERLGQGGLCVEIRDQEGTLIRSNTDLCKAIAAPGRMPLVAMPSEDTAEILIQRSAELRDLRMQASFERFELLEHKIDEVTIQFTKQKSFTEDSLIHLRARLDSLDALNRTTPCGPSPCSEGSSPTVLGSPTVVSNCEDLVQLQKEIKACVSRTKQLEEKIHDLASARMDMEHGHEIAVRALSGDVSAMCDLHRQQIVKVTEGMVELGKELSYRIERLENDAECQKSDIIEMKASHAPDRKEVQSLSQKFAAESETVKSHTTDILTLSNEISALDECLSASVRGALRRIDECESTVFATITDRLGKLADHLCAAKDEHIDSDLAALLAPVGEQREHSQGDLVVPAFALTETLSCDSSQEDRPFKSAENGESQGVNACLSTTSSRSSAARKEVQWHLDANAGGEGQRMPGSQSHEIVKMANMDQTGTDPATRPTASSASNMVPYAPRHRSMSPILRPKVSTQVGDSAYNESKDGHDSTMESMVSISSTHPAFISARDIAGHEASEVGLSERVTEGAVDEAHQTPQLQHAELQQVEQHHTVCAQTCEHQPQRLVRSDLIPKIRSVSPPNSRSRVGVTSYAGPANPPHRLAVADEADANGPLRNQLNNEHLVVRRPASSSVGQSYFDGASEVPSRKSNSISLPMAGTLKLATPPPAIGLPHAASSPPPRSSSTKMNGSSLNAPVPETAIRPTPFAFAARPREQAQQGLNYIGRESRLSRPPSTSSQHLSGPSRSLSAMQIRRSPNPSVPVFARPASIQAPPSVAWKNPGE